MKLKNINNVLLAAALLTCTACHKFLDQEPISSVTDATSWKTDDDANSQVAGCYSLIRSAFNAACTFYSYGDLPTDYWSDVADGDYKYIYQANWSVSVSSANIYDPKLKLRVWTPFYTSVQQSNRCIHFLNEMPVEAFTGSSLSEQQARRNKYLAEAKFCRAFNYFYMSRVWGDVPLDTSYQADISGITNDPRVAQENVLQSAISDLNFARQWLSYKDGSTTSDSVVRADKGSVFALLAHIYAWKGAYDSCRMACDSVIQLGGYDLVPGAAYSNIYKGQSRESIFEIAQNTTAEAMNALAYSSSIANYTLATPYVPLATPNWQISVSALNRLFADTTDQRYVNEFTYVNSGSTKYYYTTKYSNLSTVSANNVTYYLLKNNIIVFRLADIVLLRAEANAASASPDYAAAIADINTVRNRAGVTQLQSGDIAGRTALIDSVTAERGRELFLEGSRYYDLVRNARLTGVSQFPYITWPDFQKGKYYWPIDPSLMTLNSALKQTPYWQQLLTN